MTSNDSRKKKKRVANGRPVPAIDLRALIQERNWAALAGLGMIAMALLILAQRALGVHLNIWSFLLLGAGGWIVYDTIQIYEQQQRTWSDHIRNRFLVGGVILLVGLMGLLSINWWGLMLLVIGGWLGIDTYQKVESQGGVWTQTLRNRMLAAAIIGVLGAMGFFNMGSAWSVILIVIGGAMLCRHMGKC